MSNLDKVMKLKDGKILYDDARARVEELKATKAPAITNTLSGASVHIEDAAELPLEKLIVSFEPVQSGSGDPSPSNVRPISGWTNIPVKIGGKNLYDSTTYPMTSGNWISGGNGDVGNDSGISGTLDFIPVSHYRGMTITLNHRPSGNNPGFAFYATADKSTFLSGEKNVHGTEGTAWTITIPADANFMRFCVPVDTEDVQLEIGSTATAYEPYRGINTSINLGETYYGGTVDLVGGVMTVTHGCYIFDGTENWRTYDDTSKQTFRYSIALSSLPVLLYNPYTTGGSSHFKLVNGISGPYGEAAGNSYFQPKDPYGEHWGSLEAFVAWLAAQKTAGTPVQIYGQLATPQTVSLTPQIITALRGINNIFSPSGSVEVTYRADTKEFISNSINVDDVQVNGTSILSNGVANIPIGTTSKVGLVKTDVDWGLWIDGDGRMRQGVTNSAVIKAGADAYRAVHPDRQHEAVFYGLSKVAGVDLASETVTLGTYPETSKIAIRTLIGAAASSDISTKVDKTAIDNAGITNKTYTTKFNGQFSVTTAANQNYISPYARASVTGRIDKHKNHRVTINDQQYILPTRLWYIREGNGIKVYQYLGNLNLYISNTTGVPDGTDNVPFIIISDINNSSSIDVLTETAGTYTILVEQINNTQTALPKSLIWDDNYVPILKNNSGGTYNGFSIGVNELNSTRATCAIGYGNIINNQFSYSIGANNTINGDQGFAIGENLLVNKTSMTAVGYQNAASKDHTTWAANTQYNVGDVVYATINGLSLYLICTVAHTSTNVLSDIANWKPNPSNSDTAFVVGNGNPLNIDRRSNALKVDWIGNLYLGGNVYVGAGADSTGGTKLAALSDIQVDGTSIISNGIATIPKATSSKFGLVKISDGLTFGDAGVIRTNKATASDIKAASSNFKPIVPALQHAATFYGLATAAGDTTQSQSDNAVGIYTNNAKAAIQTMLGVENGVSFVETVSGTTPTITGQPNVRYVCGECSTLSITPPASGTIDVIFKSGTSVTVLTVPSTVKWPTWFHATALEASTTYEILITDGIYGSVMSWAT